MIYTLGSQNRETQKTQEALQILGLLCGDVSTECWKRGSAWKNGLILTQAEEQPEAASVFPKTCDYPQALLAGLSQNTGHPDEQIHIPDSEFPESTLKGHQMTLETWDFGAAA